MSLRIVLDFGLDAGRCTCDALDAFLPKERATWSTTDGKQVEYLPFLVALKKAEGKSEVSFWLPYWHSVRTDSPEAKEEKKFGQWAPYMDGYLFKSLIDQARMKGYV